MINYSDEPPKTNYSDYISEKLNYDYTYLSNVFSSVKGITIQHFIIVNKIEKAKELLLNDDLNVFVFLTKAGDSAGKKISMTKLSLSKESRR